MSLRLTTTSHHLDSLSRPLPTSGATTVFAAIRLGVALRTTSFPACLVPVTQDAWSKPDRYLRFVTSSAR